MADREDVRKRVIKVVSQVLKTDSAEIKPESNFVFDLGADSMDSVSLMAGFETEFNIEMDEETALEVQTVDGTVDYIIGYLEK